MKRARRDREYFHTVRNIIQNLEISEQINVMLYKM
jgi:hypothetical protein